MVLRFVCASTVPSPHSHGLTHTDGSVFIYIPYTRPAVYADRRTRISLRRTCATFAPRRACVRAVVCVRGRARIRANACEQFTPPPSVAFSARRRSTRRRPSTRTSARGTPPPSRRCPRYAPLPARRAPRRTALGRSPTHARPLRAAAPPMCARARVRAHVAMYIRVYSDGPPTDTHVCSSAIELPLHPRLSMSNAHMHRPFPCCIYT
jgi:hypothetical protein